MKGSKYAALRCYHCLPLEYLSFGEIRADPAYSDDEFFIPAYRWLEKRIGFWPHFLAVGDDQSQGITGYCCQWKRFIGCESQPDGSYKRCYRSQGEFPNYVQLVFPFSALPSPVFTDYDAWHIVLNTRLDEEEVGARALRSIFKPSWSVTDWLRHASRHPCDVQPLVPSFDTRKASEVWARNAATRGKLEAMGFSNVIVKRVPVWKW